MVNMDLLLVQRKITLTELSDQVGITLAKLSILKRGKGRAIRNFTKSFTTEAFTASLDFVHLKPPERNFSRKHADHRTPDVHRAKPPVR